MKTLPLFYYSTSWIYVDDNPSELEELSQRLNIEHHVKSFVSGIDCFNFLKSYAGKNPLSHYHFLKNLDNQNSRQTTNILDINEILKLSQDESRYDEITVLLMDLQMPDMNGLELSKELRDYNFPLQKILLTGNACEIRGIEGLNQDLIDRFILKGTSHTTTDIEKYLQDLSLIYFEKITQPLLKVLETEYPSALSDPKFIHFFTYHRKATHIEEFYLMDKQGSFLCKNNLGKTSYFIIHTARSLENFIQKNEQVLKDLPVVKKAITSREKIPFFGFQKTEGDIAPNLWETYLYSSRLIDGKENYYRMHIEK